MSLAYTVGGITVNYIGRTEFAENSLPFLAESPDGGLDSLTKTYIGAAPLLAAFLEGLVKGGSIEYNGENYYLTHWQPNGDKLWPEVSTFWFGLSDGTPDPIGDDDFSAQSITISAEIIETQQIPGSSPPAYQDVLVGLERQIEYIADQTTWRYTASTRPMGTLVGTTARGINPFIVSSVITASGGNNDGRRYAGANAPAAYVVATTPGVADQLISLRASQVYGSPFFLAEEVIARMFVG